MNDDLTIAQVLALLNSNKLQLKSTHEKVCFPILRRIYQKLQIGKRFDAIKVEQNIIVNGHHRFICLSLLGLEVNNIDWTKSPSSSIIPWPEVQVVENEWETEETIRKHNIEVGITELPESIIYSKIYSKFVE